MILYIFIGFILATAGITLILKGSRELFSGKTDNIYLGTIKAAAAWAVGLIITSVGFYLINYAVGI